jgi:hypothetical protein
MVHQDEIRTKGHQRRDNVIQDDFGFIPKRKRVNLVRLTPISYSIRVTIKEKRLITRYLTKALTSHWTT